MMHYLILVILLFIHNVSFGMAPKVNWQKALESAIQRYGVKAENQLYPLFKRANVAYPPDEVSLLAFKKEREVQLWARNKNKPWRHVHTYPLTAFSGHLGPKLKEYDRQIPEGVYRLSAFNPLSTMHLSMKIDYPNQFDRQQAKKEGRTKLGNDIFIHGKAFSVGCLAVGDEAIEQLFLLAYRVGLERIKLVIAPNDLRKQRPATLALTQPRWLPELYKNIESALRHYPASETRRV